MINYFFKSGVMPDFFMLFYKFRFLGKRLEDVRNLNVMKSVWF